MLISNPMRLRTPRSLIPFVTAAVVAWVLSPLDSIAEPENRGPLTVETWDAGNVALDSVPIPLTVYYPKEVTEPAPIVAVLHGSSRTGANMAEMAQTLASHGSVALVPNMPCNIFGCDHAANARQVRALLDWAVDRGADQESPLGGRVDGERRGVVGHSFGGLAVFLAAESHPEIDVVVVLDGQDDGGVAAAAAPSVTQPSAHLLAENLGSCNGTDWKQSVFPLTPAPHLRVVVSGSGHCDVEEPGDDLCPSVCGGGDPTLSYLFRRYTVAFVGCVLANDGDMATWVGGESLDKDSSESRLSLVESSELRSLPCHTNPKSPSAPKPPPVTDESEAGCSCASTVVGRGLVTLMFLGAFAFYFRRRFRESLVTRN
ncbi:MAG: dienelactone hydrolase family protein [Deltaproteobacteria bacterium]|nr:dienelactone hydrolase family protein [Deltaproteobacteria bacterium]